jgi:catechol-2,3-dioxygenase
VTDFTPQHIDHVEVFVRDIDAAIRWYGEVLGLKEVVRWDPEPVMIGAGKTMLALFKAEGEGRPDPDDTAPHWHRTAWRTDAAGFEAAQDHLRNLSIPFRGPLDHRLSCSIYFTDPDGNLLEITYYKKPL